MIVLCIVLLIVDLWLFIKTIQLAIIVGQPDSEISDNDFDDRVNQVYGQGRRRARRRRPLVLIIFIIGTIGFSTLTYIACYSELAMLIDYVFNQIQ
jgi:hypothetical protein